MEQKADTKLIVGIIVAALIIVGYFAFSKNKQDLNVIRIGAIEQLTGAASNIGQIAGNAVGMAIDEVNQNGGINGKKVELAVQDYGSDPKSGVSAFQKLSNDGIKLYFIDGSLALGSVAPLIRQNNDWSIAPSAALPAYTDNNPLTCRVSLTVANYSPAITSFIYSKFNGPRISLLVSNNEYGVGIRDKIKEEISQRGGQIIVDENFNFSGTDFRTQIAKLKAQEKNIDVLVITNYGITVEPLLKQLRESKFNKMVVTDNWTVLNPALKTKSFAEGMYFVDYDYVPEIQPNDSEVIKKFKQDWFAKYGTYPIVHAVNSYDAVNILMIAIKNTNSTDPKDISDYLINKMGEYRGVGGTLKFNNDCEVKRGVQIRIINDGKSELAK